MTIFEPDAIWLPTGGGHTGHFRNKVPRRGDVLEGGVPLAPEERGSRLGRIFFIVADKHGLRQLLDVVNQRLNFLVLARRQLRGSALGRDASQAQGYGAEHARREPSWHTLPPEQHGGCHGGLSGCFGMSRCMWQGCIHNRFGTCYVIIHLSLSRSLLHPP